VPREDLPLGNALFNDRSLASMASPLTQSPLLIRIDRGTGESILFPLLMIPPGGLIINPILSSINRIYEMIYFLLENSIL